MSDSHSNDTSALPPPIPQSPPLSVITATDQSGVVIIGAALALVFATISMVIRAYIRLQFGHKISMDDITSVLAMIFGVIQAILVFLATSRGFGKTLSDIAPLDLIALQKELYASDILYIMTLWFTKCSVAFLFLRLSPEKKHGIVAYIIAGATTVFMVVSVFMVAIKCNTSQPWIFVGEKCPGMLGRWQAITTLDVLTEVALFAAAALMVFSLKLSLDKKAIVIFAFAVRLPVIAAAIVRLHYLSTQLFSSDPALEGGVLAQVFTQIEISYAIITTTTPCLRPFMSALNTNYGGPATPSPGGTKYGAGGYNLSDMSKNSSRGGGGQRASSRMSALLSIGSNGHSHNASIGQAVSAYGTGDAGHNSRTGGHKAKGSVAQSSVRSNHIDGASPQTRWDDQEYSVAVHAGDHHSTGSHESTKQIINRNTEWHVEHGRGHANAWA